MEQLNGKNFYEDLDKIRSLNLDLISQLNQKYPLPGWKMLGHVDDLFVSIDMDTPAYEAYFKRGSDFNTLK